MINNRSLLKICIIVSAVSLFSSSVFFGLMMMTTTTTTLTSPSLPWTSALASTGGNETEGNGQQQPPPPGGNDTEGDGQQQPPPTEEIEPLSASFSVDSTNGDTAPATYLFEANAEGGTEPYTFSWDFGDGSQQGNEQSIDHTFENPGTYDVILTVTDSAGESTSPSRLVLVRPATTEQPPTPNATTNQTGGNRSEVSNRISVQIQPPGCTSISDAEHWNKIVFRITSDPTGRIDSSLINTELEVLERVNDGAVLSVKDIVRYSIVNEPGILLPQLTFDEVEQLEIEIMDVEYALICFTS
jgi:PKD repeat protein